MQSMTTRAAQNDALLMRAEARGCSAYLLLPLRSLGEACAAYMLASERHETERLDRAARLMTRSRLSARVIPLFPKRRA